MGLSRFGNSKGRSTPCLRRSSSLVTPIRISSLSLRRLDLAQRKRSPEIGPLTAPHIAVPPTEVDSSAPNLDVFLNVPYDKQFVNLFLAYIAGLVTLGLSPRASLEIPGGGARLDKITELIGCCSQSVHDLSRVELDMKDPPTPRFNMSFELGIVVGFHSKGTAGHTWFVFESNERRLKKSLSDLAATDPYIHDGTPRGVLSELLNAFVKSPRRPTMPQMARVNLLLRASLGIILVKAGAKTPFKARAFEELLIAARNLASDVLKEQNV